MNPTSSQLNNSEARLTADIIRRVRTVYFLRRVFNATTLKGAVVAACLVALSFAVSIPNVIGNMSRLPATSDVGYFLAAYAHTSFLVEAAVVLAVAAGVWLVVDIARNFKYIAFHFQARKVS